MKLYLLYGSAGRVIIFDGLRQAVDVVGNAMRPSFIILLLLTASSGNGQASDQTKNDAFNVSYGVSLERIDSTFLKDVRFVHFDSSVGVIFPAGYGKQKFGTNINWQKRTFFTPDTSLIKQIDISITNQYCIARKRFDDAQWKTILDYLKENNDTNSLKRAREQMAEQKSQFKQMCRQWQHDLIYLDRQYIGFITEEGDKIIYVQYLDFREDPYKLKPAFNISWIDGWHGWFETNMKRLHFNTEKNLLTINEDL